MAQYVYQATSQVVGAQNVPKPFLADQMSAENPVQNNDAYLQAQANLMRTAERQKEIAQRAINQKYAGRLNAGAVAALGAKTSSDINAGVQQQLGTLAGQQAQQREQQAYASAEAEKQRRFAHEEQLGQQQFLSGQQEKQIAEAARQYDQDYQLSKQASAVNILNALKQGDATKLAQIAAALGLTKENTGIDFGGILGTNEAANKSNAPIAPGVIPGSTVSRFKYPTRYNPSDGRYYYTGGPYSGNPATGSTNL